MEAGGPTGAARSGETTDARVGMVLQDRYRILSVLAEGGMGTVYRAERMQLGRQVAVKFLHDWAGADPQLVKRFDIEARAMSRLAHPNCVSVIDFGVAGTPYLVMDLVIGKTLRAVIREGISSAPRALRIVRQVLAGLAHAHGHGIIHRDIKPENILVEQAAGVEDHVRILDFGLAKVLGRHSDLTKGLAIGTPNYMAPEQLGVGTVDERTDVYAVGIVLFELLTGQKPFKHDDVAEVYQRQLRMPAPELRRASPRQNYSQALEAALLRAMAKAQDERFPSVAAFAAALDAVPENAQASPPPPEPPAAVPPPRPSARRSALDETAYAPAEGASTTATVAETTLVDEPRVAEVSLPPKRSRHARNIIVVATLALSAAGVALTLLTRPTARPPEPVAAAPDPAPAVGPRKPAPAPARKAPPRQATPGPATVKALRDRGERESALKLVADLRRERPQDPELAALQAELYFEKLWWTEGLASYRVALKGDPSRAGDPVLVGHLVSSLQSDRFYRRAAAFLRELGAPVRPFLKTAARQHESHSVRTRAASLLARW
jgi:eukaryotic-like serine/threonine-protein kinase